MQRYAVHSSFRRASYVKGRILMNNDNPLERSDPEISFLKQLLERARRANRTICNFDKQPKRSM